MFHRPSPLPEGVAGDALSGAIKSTPPIAVTAMSIAGIGLQDWVCFATLAYLALQAAYSIWKWIREARTNG